MVKTHRENMTWWLLFVCCTATLLLHVVMLLLSNTPLSPMKLRLTNTLDSYVNPYFSQRWTFFAPTPVSTDITLIARGRRTAQDGAPVDSPWVDVTDPLIDSVRRNRLTPNFMVELGLSNAVIQFRNNLAQDETVSYEKAGKRYVRALLPSTVSPDEMAFMRRTAAASLEVTFPGRRFTSIQLALVSRDVPKFTERRNSSKQQAAQTTQIDWQQNSWVTPYCCQAEHSVFRYPDNP